MDFMVNVIIPIFINIIIVIFILFFIIRALCYKKIRNNKAAKDYRKKRRY
jgi:Na+/H+ antiporter NhaD/arsenite permease-like protein